MSGKVIKDILVSSVVTLGKYRGFQKCRFFFRWTHIAGKRDRPREYNQVDIHLAGTLAGKEKER